MIKVLFDLQSVSAQKRHTVSKNAATVPLLLCAFKNRNLAAKLLGLVALICTL